VRVIDGQFTGVEGRVARAAGEQRVVVELEGVCLFATAYVPSAFLRKL
jgi:ribosomal protein L24